MKSPTEWCINYCKCWAVGSMTTPPPDYFQWTIPTWKFPTQDNFPFGNFPIYPKLNPLALSMKEFLRGELSVGWGIVWLGNCPGWELSWSKLVGGGVISEGELSVEKLFGWELSRGGQRVIRSGSYHHGVISNHIWYCTSHIHWLYPTYWKDFQMHFGVNLIQLGLCNDTETLLDHCCKRCNMNDEQKQPPKSILLSIDFQERGETTCEARPVLWSPVRDLRRRGATSALDILIIEEQNVSLRDISCSRYLKWR